MATTLWMSHTNIMVNRHIDSTYFPISTKIQLTATNTSHIISKNEPKTNRPLKCHIYGTYANYLMCGYELTISVYIIYLILTHGHQLCDQEHSYTYISYHSLMPLNKYTCHIIHVFPTALIPSSMCRPHITTHTGQKNKQTATFNQHAITIYAPTGNMTLKCPMYVKYAQYFI